jgi:hypothetical protein
MEIEYIEKKIRDNLINKDFEEWNRESIDFLLSIYSNQYQSFYKINLLLLEDYIRWYSKNKDKEIDNYSLENIQFQYNLINKKLDEDEGGNLIVCPHFSISTFFFIFIFFIMFLSIIFKKNTYSLPVKKRNIFDMFQKENISNISNIPNIPDISDIPDMPDIPNNLMKFISEIMLFKN